MVSRRQETQLHLRGLSRRTEALAHGGDVTRGKRKARRPFDPKQALHVVLRSSKARGSLSMLHPRHCNHIRALIDRLQKRRGVRVYRYANVGNHLHLLIRARSRADWQGFIREVSGGIAMLVTGARKGSALKRARESAMPESAKRGFWDDLVYTRIVAWGKDFKGVAEYVCTNLWEGLGIPVRRFLKRGFRCLEISEDGAILIPSHASLEVLAAFSEKRTAPG
jgi:REP element-mobilizing transposase RayT